MPESREFRGTAASAGFASGLLFVAEAGDAPSYQRQADPAAEIAVLALAVAAAIDKTAGLVEAATDDAADILEFQLAMLSDDTFPEAAHALIMNGEPADRAWTRVLNAEIANYRASEEEYFRARTADLEDIRDRVLQSLSGADELEIPIGAIVVAEDITPSAFLGHDWTGGGLALIKGSVTSHVSMLARQRGVPVITGIGPAALSGDAPALLDAAGGRLTIWPDEEAQQIFEHARAEFAADSAVSAGFAAKAAMTADGHAVTVLVNIADPEDIASIDIDHVDGVGLMRTEFLYGKGLPDEETQYQAYRKVLEWAGSKPVTIRTADAGGDKPVPGFTIAESNPFLGLRGIRLCLAKPEIFSVQVRALLRAAVHGNLKVMLPMVSVPEELEQARAIFAREEALLAKADIAHGSPELGIMVEVPSVAITPERFSKAAFFSIGSNDLTQYVMAASRDSGELAALARPDNPAVLALIKKVASYGRDQHTLVSLCGDAASDPAMTTLLLKAGVTTLSVAATRIGAIKASIAKVELKQTESAT